MDNETLDYYNTYASQFIQGTLFADMSELRQHFLSYIPPHGSILDFGCGSGRDTLYFIQQGFRTSAMDGSEELCAHASQLTGIAVKQMYFLELNEEQAYDGIWACASLLHLSAEELKEVLVLMARSLKEKGIAYISFKYGEYEGMRNGRYFLDMTEERWKSMMKAAGVFDLEEMWVTTDVRPGRDAEKWLNIIVRKKN